MLFTCLQNTVWNNLHHNVGNLNFQLNATLAIDLPCGLPSPKDLLRLLIEVLPEKSILLSQAIIIERQRLLSLQTLNENKKIFSYRNGMVGNHNDFFSFRAFKKTYSKPYLKITLCYPCCRRSIVYCLSPISWPIVGLISLGFQVHLRSLGKGIPKNQPGIELKQQLYSLLTLILWGRKYPKKHSR